MPEDTAVLQKSRHVCSGSHRRHCMTTMKSPPLFKASSPSFQSRPASFQHRYCTFSSRSARYFYSFLHLYTSNFFSRKFSRLADLSERFHGWIFPINTTIFRAVASKWEGGSLLSESGPWFGFVCMMFVPCLKFIAKHWWTVITYHQLVYKLFQTLYTGT